MKFVKVTVLTKLTIYLTLKSCGERKIDMRYARFSIILSHFLHIAEFSIGKFNIYDRMFNAKDNQDFII